MNNQQDVNIPQLPNPYVEAFGARLVALDEGIAEFELVVGPAHLNLQGNLQGGAIASLMDIACGYSGLKVATEAALSNPVTLTLSINYMASVSSGRVRACGKVVGGGRSIFFSEARLYSEEGQLLASATGTFKRLRQ